MAVWKIYRERGIARELLYKRVVWVSFRNPVYGCFARSLTFLFNSSLLHHIILSTFSNVQHALYSDFPTQLKGRRDIKKHLSIADDFYSFHSKSITMPFQSSLYIPLDRVFLHCRRLWNCGSHSCINEFYFTPNIYIYFFNEQLTINAMKIIISRASMHTWAATA